MVIGLGGVGATLALTGIVLKDLALIPDWAVTGVASIALACLIAFFVLHFETVKTFSSKRSTRLGFNSILMVLLFLGILEFINFVNASHPLRVDLSENRKFTIAPQTRNVLDNLVKPITVTVFSREGSKGEGQYRDILDTYQYRTDHIQYTISDPDKKPALARQYGITKFDTAILETEGRMAEVFSPSEQELTNAVIRITRLEKTTVYFLSGHGEPELDDTGKQGYSMLQAAIEKQGYDVSTVSFVQKPDPSKGVSVLVIAGPRRLLTRDELAQIKQYILQRGRLLLLLDPVLSADTYTGLEPLLEIRGISVGDGVIMDPDSRLSGAEITIPLVTSYLEHVITDQFNLATFFPIARALTVDKGKSTRGLSDWDIVPIAQTNESSWEERDFESADTKFDVKNDVKGPLAVAVAVAPKKIFGHGGAEVDVKRPPSMVVIGDSDFVTNAYVNFSGNRDFFLNSLHWLAEERDLISISAKVQDFEPMVLTRNEAQILLYIQVLIVPGIVFGFGIYVWQRRRRL